MAGPTVVFIHGMYMTPACWGPWLEHFRGRGYTCLAPAWPGRDRPVAQLRQAHPDPALASLTLTAILDHLAGVVGAIGQPPILIGHSMGGLVAQLLLQRVRVAAAVAVSSAPPQGVLNFSWPFVRANWGHANPFASRSQPVAMSFERFQYCFVNGLPARQQRAAFDEFVVPESRRVPAESLTGTARIDFSKPGAPLLLISGSRDHLIPAALNRTNFSRYQRSGSVTELHEFAGRTHFIIGQDGWEEVADYAAAWLERVGAAPRGRP